MTKEEAEKKMKQWKATSFCPLSREICHTRCVCFVRPRVVGGLNPHSGEEEYDFRPARCIAYCLIGPIEI